MKELNPSKKENIEFDLFFVIAKKFNHDLEKESKFQLIE
jgi:hypothetical protein